MKDVTIRVIGKDGFFQCNDTLGDLADTTSKQFQCAFSKALEHLILQLSFLDLEKNGIKELTVDFKFALTEQN